MLLGTDISAVLTTLEALKVDAIGLNCSTGPEDMRDAIRFLGEYSPVPVHCIPNAGLPLQGPDGETIFPEEPEPLADVLGEFVERFGVTIVGGCCGTTPEHIAAIVERCARHTIGPRPAPRPPHVSSMIAAAPLVQDPRPTLVGERVNSQGSRKAKELLLADDYDGLVQVAEDQVEGGAHVLDVCVALTERQDEDEQMRQVVKRVSLTQPSPIQVDSTEPDVIRTALEQIPGRAIVNSVNLEAGRDKLDIVVPLAIEHGAAVIALTIDEVGMAKTAERKVEIAQRIKELACDEHGLDPELLIFDLLTFTLTTGDEEWRPSAVETIEGIRQLKEALPRVKTSLGVSNVSFGVSPPARAVLNSVFLHHCVEAGLDLAMVNPNHITPYGEISEDERELADDLVFNRREDALERFIAHFESKGEEAEDEDADPTAGMEPEEALHLHILRRKKDGVEDWIDRSVEKIGAVPTLNDVLLPAMKEVGDKFGAGELILPFVLQSAEVMKRAVAQLEQLPRQARGLHEGHRRPRDRVRRRARHRQVAGQHDPHQQRLHGRRPRQAGPDRDDHRRGQGARRDGDRPERAARLDLQADAAVHPGAAQRGPRVPGAASAARRSTATSGCARCTPAGASPTRSTSPASSTARTPSRAWPRWTRSSTARRARRWSPRRARPRSSCATRAPSPSRATDDDSVRSAARTDAPVPEPPFWGAREIDVPLDEVYHHLDTHVLFKLHWGGRGVKGEAWRKLVDEDFRRAWSACGARRTTCTRAPSSATSPATARATRSSCSTPRTARRCSSASSSRASPSTTASAWPTSTGRRTAASSTSSRCRP